MFETSFLSFFVLSITIETMDCVEDGSKQGLSFVVLSFNEIVICSGISRATIGDTRFVLFYVTYYSFNGLVSCCWKLKAIQIQKSYIKRRVLFSLDFFPFWFERNRKAHEIFKKKLNEICHILFETLMNPFSRVYLKTIKPTL